MTAPPGRRPAVASGALGLSVAVLALLGPMAGDVVRYRVAAPLREQLVGGDVVSLGLTAPLALLAAVLCHRRSPAGPLLALGPALASWYLLAALLLGQDRGGRDGGEEAAFLPVFAGVLLLASSVAVGAWRAVPRGRVVFDRPTGVLVGVLLLAACLVDVVGRYLPAWLSLLAGRTPAGYAGGPGFWWALAVEDLTVLLPAAAVTGVGLLRRAGWAGPAAFAVSGALALVALTATGRSVAAALQDGDGSANGTVLWTSARALVPVGPAAVCWLAVLRTGKRAWREAVPPAVVVPVPRTPAQREPAPARPTRRRPPEEVRDRWHPLWP